MPSPRRSSRSLRGPVGNSHHHRILKTLPGGPYYSVSEVAWAAEVAVDTVKRWLRTGLIDPHTGGEYVYANGSQVINKYTRQDLERICEFAESTRK